MPALDDGVANRARRPARASRCSRRRTRPTPTCCSRPTRRLRRPADLVRSERSRRPEARVLLVATGWPALGAATGARLWCRRRRRAAARCPGAAARARGGRVLRRVARRLGTAQDEGHVALLGAGGGMGTTTCAVALAAGRDRAFVLDLALAMGDAADVAGAHVAAPDALLRIACGPVAAPAELVAGLAVAARLSRPAVAAAPGARRPDRRARHRAHARPRGRGWAAGDRRLRRACRRRDDSRCSSAPVSSQSSPAPMPGAPAARAACRCCSRAWASPGARPVSW